jgi:nucleotide-binding universal stress UspA family protein
MYRRILVPIQGTYTDETALQHAISLAKVTGAEVILFFAESILPTLPGLRREPNGIQNYLEQSLERIRAERVRCQVRTGRGEPAACILAEAQSAECDLIILATRARQNLLAAFLGTVADEVVHKSAVPILIVKAKASRAKRKEPVLERAGSGY